MTLVGKIEADIKIKSSAEKFHNVVSCNPDHVSKFTPEKVQGCDIHDGKFGVIGSTICWNYVHDGKAKICKQIIEDINNDDNSSRFKVIKGDLMEEYKSFKVIVKATTKKQGTFVTWTLEYEKLREDVPAPTSFLEYLGQVTKDIDAHLQVQA